MRKGKTWVEMYLHVSFVDACGEIEVFFVVCYSTAMIIQSNSSEPVYEASCIKF